MSSQGSTDSCSSKKLSLYPSPRHCQGACLYSTLFQHQTSSPFSVSSSSWVVVELVVGLGVLEPQVVKLPGWPLVVVACLCFVVSTTFAVVLRFMWLAAAIVLSVPVLFADCNGEVT